MNIYQIITTFNQEKDYRNYLIQRRWSSGVCCSFCENRQITRRTNTGRFKCNECNRSFSITSGTILHATKIPLSKWFLAISIITNAKKGVSSLQLSRDLGVNKNTAWYLQMRIRSAMVNDPTIGGILDPIKLRSRKTKTRNRKERLSGQSIIKDNILRLSYKKSARQELISMNIHVVGRSNRTHKILFRALAGQYHRLNSEHFSRYISEIEIKAKYESRTLFQLLLSRCIGKYAIW